MNNSLVQCNDWTVGYNGEDILRGIDLTLPRGILLPFVGPNGAGKTTLLRSFLKLVPGRNGSCVCNWGELPPAYVPQQKQINPLYPVSLRQIVAMGLYPEVGWWGRLKPEHRDRIDDAIERFDLMEHHRKTFAELSGGMRQKTLLARALVSGAGVLLLDEPTAGLDAASERDVLKHLIELNREGGKSILLAHHRLEDLSHLASNVCLVDRQKARIVPAQDAWRMLQSSDWGNVS